MRFFAALRMTNTRHSTVKPSALEMIILFDFYQLYLFRIVKGDVYLGWRWSRSFHSVWYFIYTYTNPGAIGILCSKIVY